MDGINVFPIGKIVNENDEVKVVLDEKYREGLKPYTPSIDRVSSVRTPAWCSHWPKSYEESGDFDWASEFNFQQ